MKIGLEVEYWVIDDDGELANDVDQLLDASEHVEGEFVAPLVELQTPPVEDEDALERELLAVCRDVLAAADEHELGLVPLGTPLVREDLPVTTERGEVLERLYGDDLEYAKNCAGTHVHFDRGNVVRQLNLLTALDPALALVNSSPFYSGSYLAKSSRAAVYRYESHAAFARYRDLWDYADGLADWERRMDENYHLLELLTSEHDIDSETLARHFHPEDAVLTPVRLRHQSPTVEWRAPDTALPSEVLRLVGEVAALVRQTDHKEVTVGEAGVWTDRIGIPPFAELRDLSTAAISDGLESLRVRDYLKTLGFDVARYHPIADRIEHRWTLPREDALALRLEYADALVADVEQLSD